MTDFKIKCAEFCPYNKELFCPFGTGDNPEILSDDFPQPHVETPEKFQEIKLKVRDKSPLPKRKKNDKVEWMIFHGTINISNVFESYDSFS